MQILVMMKFRKISRGLLEIAKVLIPMCDRWNEMGIEKWKSQDGEDKKREEKFY
jgi:hypothetical protein